MGFWVVLGYRRKSPKGIHAAHYRTYSASTSNLKQEPSSSPKPESLNHCGTPFGFRGEVQGLGCTYSLHSNSFFGLTLSQLGSYQDNPKRELQRRRKVGFGKTKTDVTTKSHALKAEEARCHRPQTLHRPGTIQGLLGGPGDVVSRL